MKRFISLILVFIMLSTGIFSSVNANTLTGTATKELESVIIAVRSKIDIDDEKFPEFTWDYSAPTYYSDASWHLYWTSADYNNNISVTCDPDGNIINYSKSEYKKDRQLYLAQKDAKEYLPDIENFINIVAPFSKGKIKLTHTYTPKSLSYPRFSYTFSRFENNIIVPDNYISVNYDFSTNQILSYSCAWEHDVQFTDSYNLISIDKAKELINTTQTLNLTYRLKTEFDENTGKATSRKAYLVYTPEISYLSVDAVTGEIYTERNTWTVTNNKDQVTNGSAGGILGGVFEDSSESLKDNIKYELNEKELEQLKVLENLISKEDAIKAVTQNQFLYIDSQATAIDAKLSKMDSPVILKNDSQQDQKYCWNITFSNPVIDEKSSYYFNSYMNARIDAQTGKLISFNANIPNYYYYTENNLPVPEFTIDKSTAQSIASEFLTVYDKDRFENTMLSNSYETIPLDYIQKTVNSTNEIQLIPVYRNANFNFVRQNENVAFTYNYLNASVDLVTGKITNYSVSWYDDVEFESTKDIISDKDALNILNSSSNGFDLNYEINSNYIYNKYLADNTDQYIDSSLLYTSLPYTRLVYSLYAPKTTTIRAIDGKLINYNGDEITSNLESYMYTDIQNHWAKDIILRFSYTGIGFEGSAFRPDEKINAKDFQTLLGMCGIYSDTDIEDNATITRTDAVKYILDSYGYKKIAALENVFITDFTDNFKISSNDVGYIAIAKGFDIIKGDGSSFRPYEALTRAECIALCFNVINSSISKA